MSDVRGRSTPRISVIIPTYNRADFLAEALASIAAQTLLPFEVIVVDDGSTDHTADVVRASALPVLYVCQDHVGVASARNRGLEKSRGDLIAWLDSDDLWEPEFLATCVSVLQEQSDWAGVYTGVTIIDSKGGDQSQRVRVTSPAQLHTQLVVGNHIATSALMVRAECFAHVGRFDLSLPVGEDYDMWLRLASQFAIGGIACALARIRVHSGNTHAVTRVFCESIERLAEKHYGGRPGCGEGYAYALRIIANKLAQSCLRDEAWEYLARAAQMHPPILDRLDTYYELACAEQPIGIRGQAHSLDIVGNGTDMIRRLGDLLAFSGPSLEAVRGRAFGSAYLALAMLSDQAAQWDLARAFIGRALASSPRLLWRRGVARRAVKLVVGKRLVRWLRRDRPGAWSEG